MRSPFSLAGVLMFIVAWLIERLVLRHLVNQEGATLLMATLGIAYVLEGVGTSVFGTDVYKIDVGMPKDPVMILEGTFEGGLLINKEDFVAALIAACWSACWRCFPEDRHRTGLAGGRRRPSGGPVDRHPAQSHLGDRLVRRRPGGAGRRGDLGFQAGRTVFAGDGGAAWSCRWSFSAV
jgi:hypothetical protein